MQTCALNAFVNILRSCYKSGNNMNNRFHTYSGHSNGIINSILSVNNELLRNDMDYFSIQRKCNSLSVFNQPVNIFLCNFILRSADAYNSSALKTLDMIAGDAHSYRTDFYTGLLFSVLYSSLNRAYRFFNVCHHTACQTFRGAFANTEYFEFSRIIIIRRCNNRTYFRSANI